jgi:cytochrome P450
VALYCLAAQPERQDALAAEVRHLVGDGPVEAEHLDRLGGVERFLKEVMRLFPPGPLLARRTIADCTIGGERLAPGAVVFIPIYAIHRHRALWRDPDLFDPERFQESEEKARHRCAYMPFGAGPRICIGASFALIEMVVGLASLLQHLRILLHGREDPRSVQRITLRPADALTLRIAPRATGP